MLRKNRNSCLISCFWCDPSIMLSLSNCSFDMAVIMHSNLIKSNNCLRVEIAFTYVYCLLACLHVCVLHFHIKRRKAMRLPVALFFPETGVRPPGKLFGINYSISVGVSGRLNISVHVCMYHDKSVRIQSVWS